MILSKIEIFEYQTSSFNIINQVVDFSNFNVFVGKLGKDFIFSVLKSLKENATIVSNVSKFNCKNLHLKVTFQKMTEKILDPIFLNPDLDDCKYDLYETVYEIKISNSKIETESLKYKINNIEDTEIEIINSFNKHLYPQGFLSILISARKSLIDSAREILEDLYNFFEGFVFLSKNEDKIKYLDEYDDFADYNQQTIFCIEELENSYDPWQLIETVNKLKGISRGRQVIISTHSPWLLDEVSIYDIVLIKNNGSFLNYYRFNELPEIKAFSQHIPPGSRYVEAFKIQEMNENNGTDIKDFQGIKDLAKRQIDLDPELMEVIDKNIWDMCEGVLNKKRRRNIMNKYILSYKKPNEDLWRDKGWEYINSIEDVISAFKKLTTNPIIKLELKGHTWSAWDVLDNTTERASMELTFYE